MPIGDEDTAAVLLVSAEDRSDPGPLARAGRSATGHPALICRA